MYGIDASAVKTLLLVLWSWVLSSAQILDVRLVDGDAPNNGRVEINIEGIGWNTLCGTSWDMNDVLVTCRQLGFAGAQLDVSRGEFGTGTLPVSRDSLLCKGMEENLNDCSLRTLRCGGGESNIAGAVCHVNSYLGCYEDNPLDRILSGTSYIDQSGMTIDLCISFCRERSYDLAGLELGSECYCGGQNENAQNNRVDDSNCRYMCTGTNLETCGGLAKMAIHRTVIPETTTTHTENPTQMEGSTPARTPGSIESSSRNTPDLSRSPTTSEVGVQTNPQPAEGYISGHIMQTIVYILGVFLLICVIVIISCLAWNCKLRSRLKSSYHVSGDDQGPPPGTRSPVHVNALPYMSLSERRTDGNGYQSLSVQRKDVHQKNARGKMDEGPYATSFGDPVYQEPGVYLEPDNATSVTYTNKKPEDPNMDELLGGGNEYETLGT